MELLDTLQPVFWLALTMAGGFVMLSTLAGFFAPVWWVFDIFSHFRVQYFLSLLFAAGLFAAGQRSLDALLSGGFALLNLTLILPFYMPSAKPDPDSKTYRILLANVLQKNNRHEKVRELIKAENPDFIVLVEVNRTWMDELQSVQSRYPYAPNLLREDNYGIAVFSRFPLLRSNVHYFCDQDIPTVVSSFDVDGETLTIIATHPPPPKSQLQAHQRDQQLDSLGGFAARQSNHTILAGDLNITPWSPHFKKLLQVSGLRNSSQGFGVQASWPTDRPWFLVPIDHILVSSAMSVQNRRPGSPTGSDHYPVIVDFSLE